VLKILNGHIYVSQQDAYQNAMYRIHRAIDLFDPSANVKFISYVKFYILHGIYDTMQEDHSLNLPLWAINARNKQNRAQKKLEEEGVPSARAAQIAYYEHDPKNLKGCITTGQDVDRTQNLQIKPPEEKETISLSPITDPAIRIILRLRYGFYGPIWKMKHIGRIFGITRQRVEQLQRRGLMAMRQHADD